MKLQFSRWLLTVAMVIVPLMSASEVAMAQSYVNITTQPGDTLSKLARSYCTTWRAIYNINQQTIGPNPNRLEPGLVLTVPSACNSGANPGNPGGVYDRGARTGATGTFSAPIYTVAWGDDIDTISVRFGVSVDIVRQANDLAWGGGTIFVGMNLVIPGTGGGVGQLPALPAGAERVRFNSGSISASRSSQTGWGQPKYYVLSAAAGQRMEIYASSHGDPLAISVARPDNITPVVNGTNYAVQNSLWLTLPMTGDYLITVTPAVMPEGPTLSFDITFVIR